MTSFGFKAFNKWVDYGRVSSFVQISVFMVFLVIIMCLLFTTFSFLSIIFCIDNQGRKGQMRLKRLYVVANNQALTNYFDLILHWRDFNLNLEGKRYSFEVFIWCTSILCTVSACSELGWFFFSAQIISVFLNYLIESKSKENGSSELCMCLSVCMCSAFTIDARTSADTYIVMTHNCWGKGLEWREKEKRWDHHSVSLPDGFTPDASRDCFLSLMYTLSLCFHIPRIYWFFSLVIDSRWEHMCVCLSVCIFLLAVN